LREPSIVGCLKIRGKISFPQILMRGSIILGVESLALAVGQQGVEERVIGTCPGIAEEEVVFYFMRICA